MLIMTKEKHVSFITRSTWSQVTSNWEYVCNMYRVRRRTYFA